MATPLPPYAVMKSACWQADLLMNNCARRDAAHWNSKDKFE